MSQALSWNSHSSAPWQSQEEAPCCGDFTELSPCPPLTLRPTHPGSTTSMRHLQGSPGGRVCFWGHPPEAPSQGLTPGTRVSPPVRMAYLDSLPEAGAAQRIAHQPASRGVTSWGPSQGVCLSCRPGHRLGACERHLINVSLPLFLPPFSSI